MTISTPLRWPLVGGDTFSALAPILGPEKKVVMSTSSTVHGGQYDNKYLVCTRNSPIDGASGIGGGGGLSSFGWNQLVSTLRDRNTTNRTIIYFDLLERIFRENFVVFIAYAYGVDITICLQI